MLPLSFADFSAAPRYAFASELREPAALPPRQAASAASADAIFAPRYYVYADAAIFRYRRRLFLSWRMRSAMRCRRQSCLRCAELSRCAAVDCIAK